MRFLTFTSMIILSLSSAASAKGDVEKGKEKSAICASCHGKDGVGIADIYPNLAGQKAAYTELQLKAFRDGQRKNMMMAPMAKPLSDEDIANLAAYYESLPAKK